MVFSSSEYTDWKKATMNFIQNWSGNFTWEWFASHCKWDNKQYSWWHWTKCTTPWAAVTQEIADKEFHNHLSHLFKIVDNNTCFNDNQKIALVSYMYNTWGNQMNLKGYIKICSHKDIKYIMSVWWWNKKYPWLKHRRIAELNLYNS